MNRKLIHEKRDKRERDRKTGRKFSVLSPFSVDLYGGSGRDKSLQKQLALLIDRSIDNLENDFHHPKGIPDKKRECSSLRPL
jgi:hypothetical protein